MQNNEKIDRIREDARERHVPILQDASLEFIELILEIRKPKTILEVGTAVGYSAINFAKHLANGGKITTIELNEDLANEARENITEMGLDNTINVVNMDAYEYMKTIDEKFDVIFIDAAKGQYMKYLEQALRLTNSGSVIIADNVLLHGMVLGGYNEHKHRTAVTRLREYLEAVTTDERLVSTIVDIGDGIAVSAVK